MLKKLLVIALLGVSIHCQSVSNLNRMLSFVDSSLTLVKKDLSAGDSLYLTYESQLAESVFLKRIQSSLSSEGILLVFDPLKAAYYLDYKTQEAGVTYTKVLKPGMLEDYFVERVVRFKGMFSLGSKRGVQKAKEFEMEAVDTIGYNQVNMVENYQYEFTKSEIPEEPFWDSIMEPLIAIGTIIITVLLLFSVRSE